MGVSGQLHAPDTHWIGGWVGPRAVLDAVVKRKIPSPRRESNPITQIFQPVAQRYTDWAITALDNVNLLGENINTIKTEKLLLHASKKQNEICYVPLSPPECRAKSYHDPRGNWTRERVFQQFKHCSHLTLWVNSLVPVRLHYFHFLFLVQPWHRQAELHATPSRAVSCNYSPKLRWLFQAGSLP
jgi:hypothetical protein